MLQIRRSTLLPVYIVSAWMLCCIQSALAADISHEVRGGRGQSSLSLELGIGLAYNKVPIFGFLDDDPDDPTGSVSGITLIIDGRAEWQGLFAEVFDESFNGGALGYTLWAGNTSELDIVLTSGFGPYDPGFGQFESLQERDPDAVSGLRSTHYLNNSVLQLELYGDISNTHNGVLAFVQAGHSWQLRNWNLHAVLGLRYFSGKILNYYFGVSEAEASASVPRYTASGGLLSTVEVGSTLPLSESWIFKTTARGHYLPDAIFDSPLANDRIAVELSTSFNYVF